MGIIGNSHAQFNWNRGRRVTLIRHRARHSSVIVSFDAVRRFQAFVEGDSGG